ncbi:MAG: tRNA 4-thiouridine(8) synthase ThiI [Methanoregulaceae archaeon]|nr:tRNA 4-thiouridine(8) synthase ThiI [Methanoregulaceae archaeon]
MEEQTVVMVRYGELFLKSEPVKRHFIGLLIRNIKKSLETAGLSFRYETPRGRILIYGDEPRKIASEVARVFGVVDVSVATVTGNSPEELGRAAGALGKKHLKAGMRFAVRAKRQKGSGGPDSQELGRVIGGVLYDDQPEAVVDLTHPEYEVFVEARENGGFVYDHRIPAPGGLPFGSQGNALGLISAGIDSPVASWLMMKRGCGMVHLNMDAGKWAGCATAEGAIENHRRLSLWVKGFPLRMLVVDSSPLYDAMSRGFPQRYICVICKRFMLRVAANLMPGEHAEVIVTGENLGQVASQTLSNLAVISSAVHVPVIRPLVTYDKADIVTIARRIGTFNQKPGDLCCKAVPAMPSTGANLADVITAEEKIDIDLLIAQAVERIRVVTALNGEITVHEKPDYEPAPAI